VVARVRVTLGSQRAHAGGLGLRDRGDVPPNTTAQTNSTKLVDIVDRTDANMRFVEYATDRVGRVNF
jgi:hypothetical protein